MNDLTRMQPPAESAAWMSQFQAMSVEELRDLVAGGIRKTVESMYYTACAVHVLVQKGDKLDGLVPGFLLYLRKIGCGQMLAEVVVYFWGNRTRINLVGNLPLDEQRRIVGGERYLTVVLDGKGTHTTMMHTVREMTDDQFRQVFDRDGARAESAQNALLADRREKASRPAPIKIGIMDLDPENKCARVGRRYISLADLKAVVRELER